MATTLTPRKDYKKGKIYKLVNDVDDKIYVGHTATTLAKRMDYHRNKAKQHPNRHVYAHLNTLGMTNVRVVLVEEYPCDNKDQLRAREQYWIDELQPELNKISAYVPDEQRTDNYKEYHEHYRQANTEHIKEYHKQYRQTNAEHYNEKHNCNVCGGKFTTTHKTHHLKSKKHQSALEAQQVDTPRPKLKVVLKKPVVTL